MKASDLFVHALEQEGVEYIFGIPGEENLDLLDSLSRSKIRLIITRHEQAAGFMAATYGRLTGKPGVCLSTLGPGATNLVTAAAYAQLGGMPMVMITGQKPIKHSKQGQFQIIDIIEMMRPLTKFTRQIVDGCRIPSTIREAFRLAMEERPGATHIELPEDVAGQDVQACLLPIHHVQRPSPDHQALQTAARIIHQAKAPLLLIGAGANRKRTCRALTEFVNKTGIPFFNTQMGVGVVDERHGLYLGTAALSDNDIVHHAIRQADLIINVGHDVVEKPPFIMTSGGTKVLHINFSSAQVDDVYFPQHEVVGDIANTMKELTERVQPAGHWDFSAFMKVKQAGALMLQRQSQIDTFPLVPPRLVSDVRLAMPDSGIVTLDNGLYKLWFARNYSAHMPNTLLLDNALATMGAGLPSAIAAKIINPDLKVVSVCGDGGFMMNAQELETAVRLGLDLVVVILNDSAYGMIKWKQKEGKQASFGLDFTNPDFVALAQAHGAHGHRVDTTAAFLPLLQKCLSSKGVHVIDVPFEYDSTSDQIKVLQLETIMEEETKPQVAGQSDKQDKLAQTVVYNPFTRTIVGQLDKHQAEDVEAALVKAHALYVNQQSWLAPHQRIAILERLAVLMQEKRSEIIGTAVAEGGKPYRDSEIEFDRAVQGVKLGITAIQTLHGEEVPMGLTAASTGRIAFTTREPIGVVVSLSAFNHPLNLIVHQVVPAIAAGCPVIVKPAIATPLTCKAFVQLLHQAGLPPDWCQMLAVSNALAEKLACDARVGYLSFIGSGRVGWYLRSKLAPGTRCALEHGGVAPVILDATVDLDSVIAPIVKGAFYHAGQVCVSAKRLYAPRAIAVELALKLASAASALKVGDPLDMTTDVGPLIRPEEVDRVDSWVGEAVNAGAKLYCGGQKVGDTCYQPTVLLDPPPHVKVSCEETFGPVLCVYSYDEIDAAIASANALPLAFQAAVFSKEIDVAMRTARRLNATAVMVNDHTAFRVDWMPFGGRKESGLGLGGIAHSVREMTQDKMYVIKTAL